MGRTLDAILAERKEREDQLKQTSLSDLIIELIDANSKLRITKKKSEDMGYEWTAVSNELYEAQQRYDAIREEIDRREETYTSKQ